MSHTSVHAAAEREKSGCVRRFATGAPIIQSQPERAEQRKRTARERKKRKKEQEESKESWCTVLDSVVRPSSTMAAA